MRNTSSRARTTNRILIGSAVVAVLAIVVIPNMIGLRHYQGDTGTCSNMAPQFYESAVRDYFANNGKPTDDIQFISGSSYGEKLSNIAFRKGAQEYYAVVDCQGGVELSVKK